MNHFAEACAVVRDTVIVIMFFSVTSILVMQGIVEGSAFVFRIVHERMNRFILPASTEDELARTPESPVKHVTFGEPEKEQQRIVPKKRFQKNKRR